MSNVKTIVVFGNTATCGYCKKFAALKGSVTFAEWLRENNVTMIDADQAKDKALYSTWKVKLRMSGAWPQVFVLDTYNKKLGSFVARSTAYLKTFTVDGLIAKIESYCDGCCSGTCGDTPSPTYKTCPTCNGTGKVLA